MKLKSINIDIIQSQFIPDYPASTGNRIFRRNYHNSPSFHCKQQNLEQNLLSYNETQAIVEEYPISNHVHFSILSKQNLGNLCCDRKSQCHSTDQFQYIFFQTSSQKKRDIQCLEIK